MLLNFTFVIFFLVHFVFLFENSENLTESSCIVQFFETQNFKFFALINNQNVINCNVFDLSKTEMEHIIALLDHNFILQYPENL